MILKLLSVFHAYDIVKYQLCDGIHILFDCSIYQGKIHITAWYSWKLKTSYFGLIALEIKSFNFKLKCQGEHYIPTQFPKMHRRAAYFSSFVQKTLLFQPMSDI